MKYKTNIPALLLASLVFISSNGFAMFEHICNTSNTRDLSFLSKPSCENDKVESTCCEKLNLKKNDNCCEQKEIFSKLNVEGFTANPIHLKPFEKQIYSHFYLINSLAINQRVFENHYSGLSPPDNPNKIKSILQPSIIDLQIFLC